MFRFRSNNFVKKPIGPVGKYVKFKGDAVGNAKLGDLISTEFNFTILSSFIVDNAKDRDALRVLFKKYFVNQREPIIHVCRFSGRDDISPGMVKNFPTVLDYLEFEDDNVFNLIIDSVGPESTLVIDEESAQKIFPNPAKVPMNARKAITPEFYKYFPATIGNYSSYYIESKSLRHLLTQESEDDGLKELESSKTSVRNDMGEHEQKLKTFQQDIKNLEHERKNIQNIVERERAKLNKIRESQQQVIHKMTELPIPGASQEKLSQELDNLKAKIETGTEAINNMKLKKKRLEHEKNERQAALANANAEFEKVAETLDKQK